MGAERVYALLLRAYPAAFREEYAREMSSAFRRRRRERGAAGAPFWIAILADVLATAVRLHAEILGRDLRDAWRSLTSRKDRSIATAAVLTLALGIGAVTAIFTIVHAVLLAPPPYHAADRVVYVYDLNPSRGIDSFASSTPNFWSLRERARSFSSLVALRGADANLTGGGPPERVTGLAVSWEFWSTLGVRPVAGRAFVEGEDGDARARVAIIGERLWQRRYGGAASTIGRTIALNGVPYTIVGIAPQNLGFSSDVDVWLPMARVPEDENRGDRRLVLLGRLAPGVTLAQAREDVRRISLDLEREFPDDNEGWRMHAITAREWIVTPEVTRGLTIVFAAVLLLLIVAITNVANLHDALQQAGRSGTHTRTPARRLLAGIQMAMATTLVISALPIPHAGHQPACLSRDDVISFRYGPHRPHVPMRDYLEQLLLVLAVGSAVAIGAKRINVPYNVALVIVGLLLVLMNVLPETPMDPGVVLMVFLPVLVFQGAVSADEASLHHSARPILALAVPGVALSLVATALISAWVIGLPFPVALLLGAVLAITDTVSVLLAFRSVRVPHRLAAIMEGESLFNDGTALVLVSVAAVVLTRGSMDPVQIARMLVIAIVAGALLGIGFGMFAAGVLSRAPDDLTAVLASVVAVFATSLITEHLGGSAVIAVVLAGVLIGREMRGRLEPSRVLALQDFWEVAAFIINVWLFLLVGMQLRSDLLLREAWPIAMAVIALHAGRAVAVYVCSGALRLAGGAIPWRWQHVMVFGNVKGALSMAAVLALPHTIVYRDRLIAIVFGVTLVTMVTQALPFRRFLSWIGVGLRTTDELADQYRAVLIGARRAQTELDNLLESGLISRHEHAERRAAFQRDIIDAERALRRRGEASYERVALPAVLAARKAAILDAARRGLITERTAAKQVAALDEEILRASGMEHDTMIEDER